jgi:hypothetical protein
MWEKNKIDKDNLKKNIPKKENTENTKLCEEKLYQSIVFCEESYSVFPT